jgi:hypothetical protein
LNEKIENLIFEISQNKYRLIIIVGKKNENSQTVEKLNMLENIKIFDLNSALSKILISYSKKELNEPVEIIQELISQKSSKDVIVFNQINILHDINLKWNVIDIFKKISRNQLLVVFWDGEYKNYILHCATKGHLEYKEYQIKKSEEILII